MRELFTRKHGTALTAIVCAALSGCAGRQPPLSYEPQAKANRPWIVRHADTPDYQREAAYISKRRIAAGVDARQPVTALCFSGGGLRSATVNLGVLQGLEEAGLLKRADYISGASGGMYIGSWFVSHLMPEGSPAVGDVGGFLSYHDNRAELLQINKGASATDGAVDALVDRRGFFMGKGNWRMFTTIPVNYAAMFPVNAVFDLALHWKPTRGKFNWHHMNLQYEKAIRRTYLKAPTKIIPGQESDPEGYFKGKPHDLTLAEINSDGSPAPYLVIGASLANAPPNTKDGNSKLLPFEFSRYAVGAPFLGYVPARDFGFPVIGELPPDGSGRRTVQRSNSLGILPFMTTKPIRLSNAIAASGAAVDSAGLSTGEVLGVKSRLRNEKTGAWVPLVTTRRLKLDTALKLFNANLRYQNRNFAMRPSSTPHNPWSFRDELNDRLTEVTTDRLRPSTNSNGLYISDGGHYDNLGVLAMLERPHVEEVWAFDAENDIDYVFSGLNRLKDLIRSAGWKPMELKDADGHPCSLPGGVKMSGKDGRKKCQEWAIGQSPVFHAVLVKDEQPGKGRRVSFWYVKTSYRASDGIIDGKPLMTLARHKHAAERETVHGFLRAYRSGEFSYRGNSTPGKFPHTSTANLSFTKNDFAAYRELGRVLGNELATQLRKTR